MTKSNDLISLQVNAETGEVVERPLNKDEIAQLNADNENPWNADILAKVSARESALEKLADLGLTAEEIAAL